MTSLRSRIPPAFLSLYGVINNLNHKYRLLSRSHRINGTQFRSYELINSHIIDVSPMLCRLMTDCEADDVVYDVGANIGTYSLVLSQQISGGLILAFEPVPSTYKRLEANLSVGAPASITRSFNFALSSQSGVGEIHTAVEDRYSTLSEDRAAAKGLLKQSEIRKRTLDSMDLPEPDRIKIDTEGHELEVLRGAKVVLQSAQPTVYLEPHTNGGYNRSDIAEFFEFCSYNVEVEEGFMVGRPK